MLIAAVPAVDPEGNLIRVGPRHSRSKITFLAPQGGKSGIPRAKNVPPGLGLPRDGPDAAHVPHYRVNMQRNTIQFCFTMIGKAQLKEVCE